MTNIYERDGRIFRSYYHGLFKRDTDLITYVTIAINIYRYHLTTIHARIITFYEDKIGYILDMKVIDISTDAIGHCRTVQGTYAKDKDFIDILKPDGITELRFMDEPICYEAFYTTKIIFSNVLKRNVLIDYLPLDIANIVLSINNKLDIINKWFNPFKVQAMNYGSKIAEFKVVPYESEETVIWCDVSEEDFEEEPLI
jgi:hypothetical protein